MNHTRLQHRAEALDTGFVCKGHWLEPQLFLFRDWFQGNETSETEQYNSTPIKSITSHPPVGVSEDSYFSGTPRSPLSEQQMATHVFLWQHMEKMLINLCHQKSWNWTTGKYIPHQAKITNRKCSSWTIKALWTYIFRRVEEN